MLPTVIFAIEMRELEEVIASVELVPSIKFPVVL
ncbi:hypothetical protein JCM5805K_2003 [Lactococcus lactis subsp. lactis]|uniref:Uncharacterized protein n=1 Tax=Lactococcus lactis subsp. lactis TaxID=1360 RepID=A0A0B8R146_LACLL|nr:hypothetical protein JCM5805K_2003 [Lactococcus lactis subsp. lactis]